ncbi:MAG: cupredoxin domain-containing protein [Chloroflexi bacterium]|nr:cupredoxin domain-containing protein [Chloroflexota bacterium]
MKWFLLSAVLVGLSVACAGYGTAPAPTQAPGAKTTPGGIREIAVTEKLATFSPATITVAKGEKVRLKLTSADLGHTFTVDELGIDINVPAGQTVTQEITAQKEGTFTLYCRPHRSQGMTGSFVVKGS